MLEKITFPEHEYESVQNRLNRQGYCYTTRVYKEVGKYKVGESYLAPWGEILRIDEIQTYRRVSDRPFYDEMSDAEKEEIRRYSEDMGLPYEFIRFSRREMSLQDGSVRESFPGTGCARINPAGKTTDEPYGVADRKPCEGDSVSGGTQMSHRKRIACLFPGIGYTCDKPLLYYSWKLLNGMGWEIVPVQYSGFPSGVKGNPEKMQQSFQMALEQAEEILRDIHWDDYDDILFIGKSVGTVVCAAYAKRHQIPCRQILFTPVEGTFRFAGRQSVVFHGTADPWAETGIIRENCKRIGIPLYETEHANHSLETGDLDFDISNMRNVMRTVKAFAEKE